MRPSRSTATVSASDSASAWSWVTSSALAPASRRIAGDLFAQRLAQAGVERGERLVEQHTSGSAASARASATRWRSPPDSSCG